MKRSGLRSTLAALLMVVAASLGIGGVQVAAAPPASAANVAVCAQAHVQNIGWMSWTCGYNGSDIQVGTTGLHLQLEALRVYWIGARGGCLNAHVQNIGWQGWRCVADWQVADLGTTGRALGIEALRIGSYGAAQCANAHVENIAGRDGDASGRAATRRLARQAQTCKWKPSV
jgi:uncharacterized protein YjdB